MNPRWKVDYIPLTRRRFYFVRLGTGPDDLAAHADTGLRTLGLEPDAERQVYIQALHVPEGWRDRGVGSALVAAVQAWARELGLPVVVWPGLVAGNPDAERRARFYAKHGFVPTGNSDWIWRKE